MNESPAPIIPEAQRNEFKIENEAQRLVYEGFKARVLELVTEGHLDLEDSETLGSYLRPRANPLGYGSTSYRRESYDRKPREVEELWFNLNMPVGTLRQLGNPGQNPETETQVRSDAYNAGQGIVIVRFPEKPGKEVNSSIWQDKLPQEGDISVQARIPMEVPEDWKGQPLLSAQQLLEHAVSEVQHQTTTSEQEQVSSII